jgi:hypothetical protein
MSPDTISDRKPDYVVILAWPYAGPITSKRQDYIDAGGQFIVPLPTADYYWPAPSGQ